MAARAKCFKRFAGALANGLKDGRQSGEDKLYIYNIIYYMSTVDAIGLLNIQYSQMLCTIQTETQSPSAKASAKFFMRKPGCS